MQTLIRLGDHKSPGFRTRSGHQIFGSKALKLLSNTLLGPFISAIHWTESTEISEDRLWNGNDFLASMAWNQFFPLFHINPSREEGEDAWDLRKPLLRWLYFELTEFNSLTYWIISQKITFNWTILSYLELARLSIFSYLEEKEACEQVECNTD